MTEGKDTLSKESMRNYVFEKYSSKVVANQYLDLYKTVIKKK